MAITQPVTIQSIRAMKAQKKICVLTAYEYWLATMLDASDVDIILVGDSLAMVSLGYADTTKVTMDEMIHHARAVCRGARRALVIGDMPFMSYQAALDDAIRNAGRFIQEAGCAAVKLEGGCEMAETVSALVARGIPVMGHIGMTPQKVHMYGGYKVQGKTAQQAAELYNAACALAAAGAFSIVMECVPMRLAQYITDHIPIPTIGIGAGSGCDGQVLVTHDILGLYGDISPKFVKEYARSGAGIPTAIEQYCSEVRACLFPDTHHSYTMPDDVWQTFIASRETS